MPTLTELDDNSESNNTAIKAGHNPASYKMAKYWKDQISAVDTNKAYINWNERGRTILKRFRDDRSSKDTDRRRMNMLWAHYNIMKPALYGKCPQLNVDRTFLSHDPTGRLSSQILERAGRNEIQYNGFHDAISKAVDDYLLPGRGQVWVRYEPKFGKSPSIPPSESTSFDDDYDKIAKETDNSKLSESIETPENEKLEDTGDMLLSESVPVDYIDWQDFYMLPVTARTWAEVQAVAKKFRITKHEAIERFGEEIGSNIRPDTEPSDSKRDKSLAEGSIFKDVNERDIVGYEIWAKTNRTVYWISEGYDYLCGVEDDPLQLDEFFPCPRPLDATTTNNTLVPVPDYIEWQDQAMQIDELTQRIANLTKACKIAGAYDSANGALKRIFSESIENELIPVDNWALFGEKGGVKGGVSLLPVEEIQSVITTLLEARQTAMQDLDVITGVNDIMRGTTDSRETLGGIRLKNNNTGTRLSNRQNEVSRFAVDTIRIMCEIMSKHFSEETLIEMSGVLFLDEMQPEIIEEQITEAKKIIVSKMPPNPMMPQMPQMPPNLMMPQIGAPPNSMGAPNPMMPQMGTPPVGAFNGSMQPQNPIQPQNQMHPPGIGIPPQPGQSDQIIPPPNVEYTIVPRRVLSMGLGLSKGDTALMLWQIDPDSVIEYRLSQSIELLRNDIPRKYRIDIETDSTIYGDREQERQDASEFIESIVKLIGEAAQIVQTVPEVMPLFGKTLQFGVRKFRTGRDLESAVDDFVAAMDRKIKEIQKNPPPNPELQKQQLEMQRTQMEIQAQRENDQRDAQRQASDDQREAQKQQMEDNRFHQESQMDMIAAKQKHDLEIQKMQMEMQLAREEHALKLQELQMKHHAAIQQTNIKLHAANQQHQLNTQAAEKELELSDRQHSQKIQQSDQQHQQKIAQNNMSHKQKQKQKNKNKGVNK